METDNIGSKVKDHENKKKLETDDKHCRNPCNNDDGSIRLGRRPYCQGNPSP